MSLRPNETQEDVLFEEEVKGWHGYAFPTNIRTLSKRVHQSEIITYMVTAT